MAAYVNDQIYSWGLEVVKSRKPPPREPRVIYKRMFEGGDGLDDMSREDLIRRIRQLNLLVMSAGNRAATLADSLEAVESCTREELDRIRSERNALQFVETENVHLRAAMAKMDKKKAEKVLDNDSTRIRICELTNSIVVLEGMLQSKQDYIDCCEAEISGLKAVVCMHKQPIYSNPTPMGFLG